MGGKTWKRIIYFFVAMVVVFLLTSQLKILWVPIAIAATTLVGIVAIALLSEGKGKDTRDAEEILDDINKKLDKINDSKR